MGLVTVLIERGWVLSTTGHLNPPTSKSSTTSIEIKQSSIETLAQTYYGTSSAQKRSKSIASMNQLIYQLGALALSTSAPTTIKNQIPNSNSRLKIIKIDSDKNTNLDLLLAKMGLPVKPAHEVTVKSQPVKTINKKSLSIKYTSQARRSLVVLACTFAEYIDKKNVSLETYSRVKEDLEVRLEILTILVDSLDSNFLSTDEFEIKNVIGLVDQLKNSLTSYYHVFFFGDNTAYIALDRYSERIVMVYFVNQVLVSSAFKIGFCNGRQGFNVTRSRYCNALSIKRHNNFDQEIEVKSSIFFCNFDNHSNYKLSFNEN